MSDVDAPARPRLLIVDDDPALRTLIRDFLTGQGYGVDEAEDGPSMRAALARQRADIVILDVMMPGEDGLSLARSLGEFGAVKVISGNIAQQTQTQISFKSAAYQFPGHIIFKDIDIFAGHGKQPVILRVQNANHEEGGGPHRDLRDDLRPRSPDYGAPDLRKQAGRIGIRRIRRGFHDVRLTAAPL